MNIFETLAEPTRRRIVELLADQERSVKELCDQFDISQPAVSRHLRVLREARLGLILDFVLYIKQLQH